MKTHFFWFIYVVTIVCAGGWYIKQQHKTIAKQEFTIQELTASQRPPIVPEKTKVKVVEREIDRNEVCKEVIVKYNELKQQTLQCAYNLKFCQESNPVFQNGLKPKEQTDGKGDKN